MHHWNKRNERDIKRSAETPPALLAIYYRCKRRIVLFLFNVLWMYTRAEQQFPDRPSANRTRDRPPDLFSHHFGCVAVFLFCRDFGSLLPLSFISYSIISWAFICWYSRDCTWLWIRLPVCVRCVAHFYDDTVDDSLSAFYLVTIETPL